VDQKATDPLTIVAVGLFYDVF